MTIAHALTVSSGLRTDVDEIRTAVQPGANAPQPLMSCSNIDIDSTGMIRSRKGYTKVISGNWHSLFDYPELGGLIGVEGDALSIVGYDGSFVTRLRKVSTGKRMKYADTTYAGNQDARVVFYSNGIEGGKIINGFSYPCSTPSYVGPETIRRFSAPFEAASALCVHQGRLFLVNGNSVYYSEPFAYEMFDYAANFFVLPNEIFDIIAMDEDSLFIASSDGGWMVKGGIGTNNMALLRVFTEPCIRGNCIRSRHKILNVGNGNFVNPILVMTQKGVMVVSSESRLYVNITERAINDRVLNGAGSFVGCHADHKFIFSLEE